jgi:hypothetical protein
MFNHSNSKVREALPIILGVMIKRGPRRGHRKLKDFAPKIRQDIYPAVVERLGTDRDAQMHTIETALEVAASRHLVRFDARSERLYHTRKGWKARKAYLNLLNDGKNTAGKQTLGRPMYAR